MGVHVEEEGGKEKEKENTRNKRNTVGDKQVRRQALRYVQHGQYGRAQKISENAHDYGFSLAR